jgi:hypothetical protein
LKDAAVARLARRWSMSHLLVGTQVALSIVVLVVAALLVRSLLNLRTLDAGFDGGNLLLVTVDTAGTSVTPEARLPIYLAVLDRLRAAPGVEYGIGLEIDADSHSGDARRLVMPPEVPDTVDARAVFTNPITPEYFDTLGIRLLARTAAHRSRHRQLARVAVVNETMAKFIAGDRDAVGKTFAFKGEPKDLIEIVGVVQDTRQMNLRDAPIRTAYTPMTQASSAPSYFQIEIRTAQDPAGVDRQPAAADPKRERNLVIRYLRTMDQQIDASLVRERLLATLSAGFALLALVAVGDWFVRRDVLHGDAALA